MAKPKLLGIRYARLAEPVRAAWDMEAKSEDKEVQRFAKAMLKSLRTLETRCLANPLTGGDHVQAKDWPRCTTQDYGAIPNLFRFELAERWRGFYALIGEPGGVRVVILYLWDHPTYDKMLGYAKK